MDLVDAQIARALDSKAKAGAAHSYDVLTLDLARSRGAKEASKLYGDVQASQGRRFYVVEAQGGIYSCSIQVKEPEL